MLPIDYSEGGAVGAADTVPITVSGIKAGDVLLGLVAWSAGTDPAPLDISDYTVADGTITGATVDSSGKSLWVRWITPRA